MTAVSAVRAAIVRRFRADMAEAAGIPGEPVPTLAETLATLNRNARTRAANDRVLAAAHAADAGWRSGGSGMSAFKGTPGPWIVGEDGDVIWAERWKGTIPHVATVPFSKDPRVAADARLIAAAPDLLEALRGMMAAYEELHARYDLGECQATVDARAAIAKATGEQP